MSENTNNGDKPSDCSQYPGTVFGSSGFKYMRIPDSLTVGRRRTMVVMSARVRVRVQGGRLWV